MTSPKNRTPDIVDAAELITKYTGHHLDPDTLTVGLHDTSLAAELATAIGRAALSLGDAETELARITTSITHSLTKVSTTITAEPGSPAPGLNPVGELHAYGPRFDTLIAMREDRIQHLRTLVQLWRRLPTPGTGAHHT